MEQVKHIQSQSNYTISKELYDKLNYLGLIPNEVRSGNIGKSNYSKRFIQPWSIWIDHQLDPWDADIVKRVLRTKEEEGMTEEESRIMDYTKIKHICDEKIRQLKSNIPTLQATNEMCEATVISEPNKLQISKNLPVWTEGCYLVDI